MASPGWTSKECAVAGLHLDSKNPRLGRETSARAPREILQYLFEHDKALEVAASIAKRGYFPNEPLLAIRENGHLVVVEGNRRLAALKALREPGLLEGADRRKIERLAREIADMEELAKVPVTIAPSRKATDRQIAGRHIGTPVLPWEAENRASFILEKLAEGYTNAQLSEQLGFDASHIQAARQTRAIADMARSLELAPEVMAKIDGPRAKVFTTIERVFDSTVGRNFFMVEPDPDHGLRGKTSKAEFVRAFTKLVTDVALGRQSSRSLNKSEDIENYFKTWKDKERPTKARGAFVPADVIAGRSVASKNTKAVVPKADPRAKLASKTVVPKAFKVTSGNDRLVDIRDELVRIKREEFPNAGAVLLRVFFELSVVDYLTRTGKLQELVSHIERREGRRLPHGLPTLKQMVPAIIDAAKTGLKVPEANKVEKAVRYDAAAPFTISELHGFVHHTDFPTARDIQQFWDRTEPLFRLMLATAGPAGS